MIEDLLKKRINISFFSKKIPDKKVVEEILEKAHNLTPHKNNFWHYEVDVYGPEHAEQKKTLALATVCSGHKDYYRQENLNDNVEKNWTKSDVYPATIMHLAQIQSTVIKTINLSSKAASISCLRP